MKVIDLLPLSLHRGSAFLIIALSIFLVTVHVVLVALAVERTSLRARQRVSIPLVVGAYLAAWLALAFVVGDKENFRLASGDSRRTIALLAAFGPLLAAVGLLFWSRTIRAMNAAMPSSWLIWVQSYRVAGALFLYPFLAYGLVPPAFAVPAGVGDIVTGALAPLVAHGVATRRPNALGWAVAWNLFGILDLVVAVGTAIGSRAGIISLYPLALIALFLGPPLAITTHLYSLRNLAVASRTSALESQLRSTDRSVPAA